jgi:hypothetical protein
MTNCTRAIRTLTPLLLCLATSCATAPGVEVEADVPVEAESTPWTSLELDDSNDDFDFVVVTDRTGEHRPGVFNGAMPKVNLLKPAFVMSVGDLIEGYSEDRAALDSEWDEFEGFIAQLEMPFFYLPGNHDLSNETMAHVWRERFGASYYHFVYKNVLFLALNSELFSMVSKPGTTLPGPDLQAEQMAYVERVLADHPDVRWTLVFIHQPLWDASTIHPDWLRIEGWLGDRPHTAFAGHFHEYTLHRRNGRNYVTLATTGGGSGMRGLLHGEFDHVAMVSMRKDGPVVANLLLDGIQGIDVRDAETRSVMQKLERAVRTNAMQFDGSEFESGVVTFDVHNDGDAPLTLKGTIHASRDLAADEPEVALEVAPNSVAQISVPISATEPAPFEALAAATAAWRISTLGPGGTPVEIDLESSIAPGRSFHCHPPQRPIELDGSLTEWDALAIVADPPAVIERAEHVEGRDDGSFRFDLRCDDENLYVGIGVRDDSIVASPDRIGREQDAVSISFDARDDPARSSGGQGFFGAISDGTFGKLVMVTAGPEPNPAEDPVLGVFLPPQPEGIRTASRVRESGYDLEVAVPLAVLDEKHGDRFDRVRLDVSVYDFDEGDPGHATLWWRPSRFSSQAIPGSGTFIRP